MEAVSPLFSWAGWFDSPILRFFISSKRTFFVDDLILFFIQCSGIIVPRIPDSGYFWDHQLKLYRNSRLSKFQFNSLSRRRLLMKYNYTGSNCARNAANSVDWVVSWCYFAADLMQWGSIARSLSGNTFDSSR